MPTFVYKGLTKKEQDELRPKLRALQAPKTGRPDPRRESPEQVDAKNNLRKKELEARYAEVEDEIAARSAQACVQGKMFFAGKPRFVDPESEGGEALIRKCRNLVAMRIMDEVDDSKAVKEEPVAEVPAAVEEEPKKRGPGRPPKAQEV